MNIEDFETLDNEAFDKSIIKRDFLKVYPEQGANLNDSDQNVEFIFGENNNYHQVGNYYLEFGITIRIPSAAFDDNSAIRMTNNAFAYVFKARLSTRSESDFEHDNFVGEISTILRVLTSKDGDLLSQFDNINESTGAEDSATSTTFRNISLKKMLIDDQETEANTGKIKGQLPLEIQKGNKKSRFPFEI